MIFLENIFDNTSSDTTNRHLHSYILCFCFKDTKIRKAQAGQYNKERKTDFVVLLRKFQLCIHIVHSPFHLFSRLFFISQLFSLKWNVWGPYSNLNVLTEMVKLFSSSSSNCFVFCRQNLPQGLNKLHWVWDRVQQTVTQRSPTLLSSSGNFLLNWRENVQHTQMRYMFDLR